MASEILALSYLIVSMTAFIYLSIFGLKSSVLNIIYIILFLWTIGGGILLCSFRHTDFNDNSLYTLIGINHLLALGLLTFLNFYLKTAKKCK